MQLRLPFAMAFALLTLSACDSATNPPAVTNAPAESSAAAPVMPAPAEAKHSGIWFEPAAVSACSKKEKVLVHWDASDHPDVKSIEIYAIGNGKEHLFARTRAVGSKITGPWMGAGVIMVLRNQADGSELGRATVESAACNK